MSEETSKCRSCDSDIVWADVNGKKIPLNKRRVRVYGLGTDGGAVDNGVMHISHFNTCPDATKWSKNK